MSGFGDYIAARRKAPPDELLEQIGLALNIPADVL
jgi:hypothetical protein